jgi:hypothetical protein
VDFLSALANKSLILPQRQKQAGIYLFFLIQYFKMQMSRNGRSAAATMTAADFFLEMKTMSLRITTGEKLQLCQHCDDK